MESGEADDLVRVGEALAELHGQKPRPEFRLLGRHVDRLGAIGDYLARLLPELQSDLVTLGGSLTRNLGDTNAKVLTHGDLHPHQILLDDGRVSLIDLDRLSLADGRFDLGNLLAHLEFERFAAGDGVDMKWAAEALLDGYARRAGIPAMDWQDLGPFVAAGLLLLGSEPFRLRHHRWREMTRRLIERARELAESGRSDSARPAAAPSPHSDAGMAAAGLEETMPSLEEALDPAIVERELAVLASPDDAGGEWKVVGARLLRHKPGRRALIEYQVIRDGSEAVLLGKCRFRGVDRSTPVAMAALRAAGFSEAGGLGVMVPKPIGIIPRFRMFLQERVVATPSLDLLVSRTGVQSAERIAEGAFRLHRSGVAARRRHTMDDELATLHAGLSALAGDRPNLAWRIERLLAACGRLGHEVAPPLRDSSIHRDFYHDQVLLTSDRVVIVDLDLFAMGDAAVDVGNFLAHLIEWSLRTEGDPDWLADVRIALEDRYVALAGEQARASIRAYEALSLVRHVYLSTRFAERTPMTEPLLSLCEELIERQARGAEKHIGR
jgi:Ser/Thr protein kinase RdoA (MazF antagonist)